SLRSLWPQGRGGSNPLFRISATRPLSRIFTRFVRLCRRCRQGARPYLRRARSEWGRRIASTVCLVPPDLKYLPGRTRSARRSMVEASLFSVSIYRRPAWPNVHRHAHTKTLVIAGEGVHRNEPATA